MNKRGAIIAAVILMALMLTFVSSCQAPTPPTSPDVTKETPVIKNQSPSPVPSAPSPEKYTDDNQCLKCYGNGKCHVCDGTGEFSGDKCGICNGTGVCSFCDGTGVAK